MPRLSAKEKASAMWIHHVRPTPFGRKFSNTERKLYFKVLAEHYKTGGTLYLPLLLILKAEMEGKSSSSAQNQNMTVMQCVPEKHGKKYAY